MEKIVIVAKVKVKEEFKNYVYEKLVSLHNDTKKLDKGCIQYDLHKDLNDKNSFIFVETWESSFYLSKHEEKEHFTTFVKNVEDKLESLEINKLNKLDI